MDWGALAAVCELYHVSIDEALVQRLLTIGELTQQ
jgi:hypothetical protein